MSRISVPDPHLVHTLAILDVLEAALVAATHSVQADHPDLTEQRARFDPTAEQQAAGHLCASADALTAALRDYRLILLDAYAL